MACPTCDHTMQSVTDKVWWCSRCGTLKADRESRPVLVERVFRYFKAPNDANRAAVEECYKGD